MDKIKIRSAKANEASKLTEVFTAAFVRDVPSKELIDKLTENFRLFINNKIHTFYVAIDNDKIVGMGGETNHSGVSYIGFIGVLTEYRKQGIGTRIFNELFDLAKEHNSTVELFSNIGADSIYRRFGFQDQFETYIYELAKPLQTNSNYNVKTNYNSLEDWMLELDKISMGFDRSNYLKHIFKFQKPSLSCIDSKGYAFCLDNKIGPIIATSKEVAFSLINSYLVSSPKRIIIPKRLERLFIPYSTKKLHTCIKMSYGKLIKTNNPWLWGYYSFAAS